MDYYETLKPQADEAAGVFHRAVTDLKKQVAALSKSLADERNMSERLEARIARLKKEAGRSLAQGGKNLYEKFRTDFTKRARDLETSKELVISLELTLSQKQQELAMAETNLRISLNAYLLKCRPIADARIDELLKECITVRQDFLDAFTRLYGEYGLDLVISDESYCPGRWWNSVEVKEMRRKLKMDGELPDYDAIKLAAQASTAKPPTMAEVAPAEAQGVAEGSGIPAEAVSLPVVPQNEPEDEQTPSEGSLIPLVAGSQAVDAEPASAEALGTTPEPVGEDSEQSKTLLTGKV